MDPLECDVKVKEKIGYVSEDRSMYGWMKVKEVLEFNRGLYPLWDQGMAIQLLKDFDLDPAQRVKVLSRGMLAKLALLVALASKPEVLILDEPSSGLDPMVRREILEKLITYVSDFKTTIFFSSHLIDEVDRMADNVGIICKGKLIVCDDKNTVKESLRRVVITFEPRRDSIPEHPSIMRKEQKDGEWNIILKKDDGSGEKHLASLQPRSLEIHELSLEDVFAEYVKWEREHRS
jgi:ABC-2 type transport system ATP-binding protein